MVDRGKYFPRKWSPRRPSRLWRAVKAGVPYLLVTAAVCAEIDWVHSRHPMQRHDQNRSQRTFPGGVLERGGTNEH